MPDQQQPYTISDERIAEIQNSANGQAAQLSAAEIRATCLYDWPEGEHHQRWLNTAPADEIAAWIVAVRADVQETNELIDFAQDNTPDDDDEQRAIERENAAR